MFKEGEKKKELFEKSLKGYLFIVLFLNSPLIFLKAA